MSERIWEGSTLTPDVVRVWGYDEALLLLEQDEDLLLYNVKFIPVLLEMAGDERCVKQEYAFWILCQFCRNSIAHGSERDTAMIFTTWSSIPKPPDGNAQEWHRYVGRLLNYTKPSGPVEFPIARQMANDLLLGIAGRLGEIKETNSPKPGWWRFTLTTSLTEHVDICQISGAFSYTKCY